MTTYAGSQNLRPGIVEKLGQTSLPEPVSYLDEVKQYLGSSGNIHPFPFINQDRSFRRMMSYLAQSPYPYAVLVGSPGIGKTLMTDYLLDIIEGRVTEDDLRKADPNLPEEVKMLRARLDRFEHRDYMILPNLHRPRNPVVLSYRNGDIERDLQAATEYSKAMTALLMNYVRDNAARMRLKFTGAEFEEYFNSKVAEFYVSLYDDIDSMTRKNKDAAFVVVKPRKKGPKQMDYQIDAHWKFLNSGVKVSGYRAKAGYTPKAKGIERSDVERGLARTYIPEHMRAHFNVLMRTLMSADVEENNTRELEERVYNLFDTFNGNRMAALRDSVEQQGVVSPGMIVSQIRQFPRYRGAIRLSDGVHQDLISRVSSIKDAYDGNGISPELRAWMQQNVEYFKGETWQTERTMLSILEKQARGEVESKEKGTKDDDDKDGDKEKGYRVTEREYTGDAFELRHGDFFTPADRIFQANVFKNLSASHVVNNVVITDFSSDGLFGTFREHDKEMPPHMTYTSLGKFFQGGILVFPDYFGRFIETMHYGDEESSSSGMRERFLEFLQRGVIDVVDDGTTFRMEAPRMIIGSSNENPFVYTDGFFTFHDDGMADRIEVINVPEMAQNSASVRRGSINIIYKKAEEFAASNGGVGIEISSEAADLILRESLLSDSMASLTYRAFGKRVDEILRHARRNRQQQVTLETLRELNRELFQDVRFALIDMDYNNPGGYRDMPQKQNGFVNGVSVLALRTAGGHEVASKRFPLASYIVEPRDSLSLDQERFVLIDENKRMSRETTNKGYVLAADFVKNLIANLRSRRGRRSGWQLKTEFYEGWGITDGPSASNTAAISMVSALAGDEIYKNRFFTGTLQPETGEVGSISGVYYKTLVPARLSTLLERDQLREEVYFIFPASNRPELKEAVLTDPVGVDSRIASIPVRSFWQSYYLATSGPSVTEGDIDDIEQRAKQKHGETLEKIRQRLGELEQ